MASKNPTPRILSSSVLVLALLFGGLIGFTFVHIRREQRNQTLIATVEHMDAHAVQRLLVEGADANAREVPANGRPFWRRCWDALRGRHQNAIAGRTALMCAVLRGPAVSEPKRLEIVRALLDRGADLNAGDVHGEAPLSLAAANGWPKIVRLLLDRGADPNATDPCGSTALQYATFLSSRGRDPYDICLLLLQRGANPTVQNSTGWTPLMSAICSRQEHTARLLVQWKTDVNVGWREHRRTALEFAHNWLPSFVPVLKRAGAKEPDGSPAGGYRAP